MKRMGPRAVTLRMKQRHWIRVMFRKQNCRTCCLDLGKVEERRERHTSKVLAGMNG